MSDGNDGWITPKEALAIIRGENWIPSMRDPYREQRRILQWAVDRRLRAKISTLIVHVPFDVYHATLKPQADAHTCIVISDSILKGVFRPSPNRTSTYPLVRVSRENVNLEYFEWTDLTLSEKDDDWWDTAELVIGDPFGWRLALYGIRFWRDDILLCAGLPVPVVPAVRPASLASAEAKCEEWLHNAFAADPERRRNKSELERTACSEITGLSGEAFRRAWETVAPKHGRNLPGRPKRPREMNGEA